VRAWDFSKPGFFALAMNSYMYEHFITKKQVNILLDEFKFFEIQVVEKILKCGDYGKGGIADTIDIFQTIINYLDKDN
jgi:phosphopantothenoylcysteine decarboxylase